MKMSKQTSLSRFMLFCLVASFLFAVACGGGGSSSTPAPTTGGTSQQSVITIGDAPNDSIVSFEITVSSVVLSGSGGNVTALSTPRRLEMTHLSATVESLALLSIPNGTYTQATIQWSHPEVTFIDAAGALHEVDFGTAATGTANIPINVTISAGTVLNFDIDVAASVTVNTATGTAALATPTFTLTAARGLGETEREAETGELEHVVGAVVGTPTATSLTIAAGTAGTNLTFTINSSTQLEGVTSTSQLVNNQVVRVEGRVQADGSLLASEVEAESANGTGVEMEGIVTSITGTSFTMIAHDSTGTSVSSNDLGKTITVNAGTATFKVSKTKINVGSLTFTSIADLHKGQHVEVDNDTPKSAGAGTVSDDGSLNSVKKIKLVQQTLKGVISSATPNTFVLTVPADSAFAKIAGTTTITVNNNGAQLKNGATVTNGATVRVRGLLFANNVGYTMAAGRITTP